MMGQHQQETVASGALRRVIVVLAIAAVLVSIVMVSAAPAFAKGGPGLERCVTLGEKGVFPHACRR